MGQNGTIVTSSDGLEWTEKSGPTTSLTFDSVRFHNGVWTAVGGTPSILGNAGALIAQSLDGAETWTERTSIPDSDFTGINDFAIDDAGLYLAAVQDQATNPTDGGRIFKSTDSGVIWTDDQTLITDAGALTAIEHDGDGLWIIGGADSNVSRIWSSTNGSSWTERDYPDGGVGVGISILQITAGGGKWIAVDGNGQIVRSLNGISWSVVHDIGTDTVICVGYNGRNLWAVGAVNGQLLTSADGISWSTQVSSFGTSNIGGIAHNQIGT